MLVLARKVSESIVIGAGSEMVVVTVLGVEGSRVRLGFAADRSVAIRRPEAGTGVADRAERLAARRSRDPVRIEDRG